MCQLLSFLTTFSFFGGCVYSHSWLHCSDYSSPSSLNGGGTFDDANCNGYIRQWNTIWGATTFGTDRGVNYQPSGSWCQSAFNSDIDSMYDDGYPMAQWNYDETVTLVWPAKNHANYECTDNIPDNSMKLFYYNSVNPTSELSYVNGVNNAEADGWTLLIDWIADLGCTAGTDGCGFQNCPNYCADTGLAPCWQQYTVSSNDFASAGKYTLMWYWEFNAGSFYTTCFEVEITGETDSGSSSSSSSSSGSTNFDDYIIQIPINYFGDIFDEDTLTTGANNIILDDGSISYNFVVVGDASVKTDNLIEWNATIQTNTNSPGTIFNEAYDYTSNPEGDSQLCDKIEEAFASGTCTIEPGKIIIYGESSGNHFYGDVNKLLFVTLTLFILFLIQ